MVSTETIDDVRQAEAEQQAAAKAKLIKSFWEKNANGYTLLPEVYRDDIVASGAVVLVHAVRDGETKHGATWFTDMEYRGEMWTWPQSHNVVRDRFMLNARDYISAFGPLPAIIVSYDSVKGQGFDYAAPPDDYLGALESGTGELPAIDGAPF